MLNGTNISLREQEELTFSTDNVKDGKRKQHGKLSEVEIHIICMKRTYESCNSGFSLYLLTRSERWECGLVALLKVLL